MNIDNGITLQRIKKALGLKTVVAVLLIVSVLSVIFYITLNNRERKEILIWHITADAENHFSEDALKAINDYGVQKDFDRILITKRHPEDTYFDALMTVSAYYTCDIFIMQKSVAEKYADIFMPLSDYKNTSQEVLCIGSKPVGVLLYEDYYLLINSKTNVELQELYQILDILIEKK